MEDRYAKSTDKQLAEFLMLRIKHQYWDNENRVINFPEGFDGDSLKVAYELAERICATKKVVYEIKGWSLGKLTDHYAGGVLTKEFALLYNGEDLGSYFTEGDGTYKKLEFYKELKNAKLYSEKEEEYGEEFELEFKGVLTDSFILVKTLYQIWEWQFIQGNAPIELEIVLNYERDIFGSYTLKKITKIGEEMSKYRRELKGSLVNV